MWPKTRRSRSSTEPASHAQQAPTNRIAPDRSKPRLSAGSLFGIATVTGLSEHRTEYVAWAWAVNGFFSVMGSVLSTILSMTFGFGLVLAIAFGVYAVGVAALASLPSRAAGRVA